MMVIGGMKLKLGRMNYGLAADNVTGQLQFRFVAMATAFRPIGDTTGSCNKEAGHLLVDHYLTVRTPAETFSKFRASLNLISNRLGIPTIPRIPRNLKNLDATVGKGGGRIEAVVEPDNIQSIWKCLTNIWNSVELAPAESGWIQ